MHYSYTIISRHALGTGDIEKLPHNLTKGGLRDENRF